MTSEIVSRQTASLSPRGRARTTDGPPSGGFFPAETNRRRLTLLLEVIELLEESGDINNDSGSDKGLAVGVHET